MIWCRKDFRGTHICKCCNYFLRFAFICSASLVFSEYCVLLSWCTKVQAVLIGQSTVLGFDLTWFSCQSSERLCTRGSQKVLSLNILPIFLVEKMLHGFNSRPLVVSLNNYMLVYFTRYIIEYSSLVVAQYSMTDFNKVRYRPVTEFLTLENVQPQRIYKRMIVVYGECYHMALPRSSVRLLSFIESEEAFKPGEPQSGRPCEAV